MVVVLRLVLGAMPNPCIDFHQKVPVIGYILNTYIILSVVVYCV